MDTAIDGPSDSSTGTRRSRIPLLLKVAYSAFMLVMVPFYLHQYGARNFLYFCDVAMLVTLVAVWTESAFLVSLEAVAILIPQLLWLADVACRMVHVKFLGMTDYMFDPGIPLFVRLISTFHGWLPLLLLWMLSRVGYDRRALRFQIVIGVAQLLVCFFAFTPPGPGVSGPRVVNLNYVYGLADDHAQTSLPPLGWLAVLILGIPLLMYVPTHFALRAIFSKPRNAT